MFLCWCGFLLINIAESFNVKPVYWRSNNNIYFSCTNYYIIYNWNIFSKLMIFSHNNPIKFLKILFKNLVISIWQYWCCYWYRLCLSVVFHSDFVSTIKVVHVSNVFFSSILNCRYLLRGLSFYYCRHSFPSYAI